MPYIKPDSRAKFDEAIKLIPKTLHPGELNYVITQLLDGFVTAHGLDYTTLNAAMGVMSSAQAEFYRRVVVPYEEGKRASNGDAYRNV